MPTTVAVSDARGLTAELIKPEKPTPNALKIKLNAAADAALGTREMRILTPLGVTPPLTISAVTEASLAGSPADIGRAIADVDRRHRPQAIVITRSATASVLQEPLDGEISMIPAGTIDADRSSSIVHSRQLMWNV